MSFGKPLGFILLELLRSIGNALYEFREAPGIYFVGTPTKYWNSAQVKPGRARGARARVLQLTGLENLTASTEPHRLPMGSLSEPHRLPTGSPAAA
jgi:hypothetical protein